MVFLNNNDIDRIRKQYENGLNVRRKEKIFYQNILGVRKSGIVYDYSHEELNEYGKCSNIGYFINKYPTIKLHKFQKDLIEHVKENKFTINMRSMQTGVCRTMILYFLHELLFNIDRSIIIFNNKSLESIELINIFKEMYKSLPFYLQVGVRLWNSTNIVFDNGSRITFKTYTKTPAIGANYDIWFLNDFAKISESVSEIFVRNVFPIVSALKNCRLIISSPPNGFNNFYRILQGSEVGTNSFKSIKTYWWQVPNRGESWKIKEIEKIGDEYLFMQEYELMFILKRGSL